MQVDPQYPANINTKECRVGMERHHQRDMAVQPALALHEQFKVHGDMLEKVKAYRYLGHLLLQDDNNVQAMWSQLCKARGTWARVGQVLHRENAPPRTSAKFYKAIVQSILMYGSKAWVLSKALMARLEGFHICLVYWMAKEHMPLPIIRQGIRGVQDAHNPTLHQCMTADNHMVRSGLRHLCQM
jgi:hypothetical protein